MVEVVMKKLILFIILILSSSLLFFLIQQILIPDELIARHFSQQLSITRIEQMCRSSNQSGPLLFED